MNLGIINIYDMKNNAIKRWGHRACLPVIRLLNWGIFIGWALKIRFTFTQNYQGKSLLLETHKILSWKWSFFYIQISSIASFKPFLIAWLWGYCTFLGSSVVRSLLYLFFYFRFASPWPKHTQHGAIFQKKKIVFYCQTFFLLQRCSLLDCS